MKKSFAYAVTGILLGVAIMLIPSNLFIDLGYTKAGIRGSTQCYAPETEKEPSVAAMAAFSPSLTYVGLMFVISLISALSVYFFFKRRMTT